MSAHPCITKCKAQWLHRCNKSPYCWNYNLFSALKTTCTSPVSGDSTLLKTNKQSLSFCISRLSLPRLCNWPALCGLWHQRGVFLHTIAEYSEASAWLQLVKLSVEPTAWRPWLKYPCQSLINTIRLHIVNDGNASPLWLNALKLWCRVFVGKWWN